MKPLFTVAVLLLGTVVANAQGTPSTGGTVNANQCWDVSAGRVKDRVPGIATSGPKDQPTVGSSASSASSATSPEGSTGKGTSPEAVKSAAVRPAGMPDC